MSVERAPVPIARPSRPETVAALLRPGGFAMNAETEILRAEDVAINPRTRQAASPTDPATWATFDEAWRSGYKYIGFVLSESDPYTIIDLDNKPHNPATPEQLERHKKILETFNSYTERSVSG